MTKLLYYTICLTFCEIILAAPHSNLESIFHTPKKSKYDDLEILERSNFDTDATAKNSNTVDPRSYANAQVLLRFSDNPTTTTTTTNTQRSCNCGDECRCRLPIIYPVPLLIPDCLYTNFYRQIQNPTALPTVSTIPNSVTTTTTECPTTTQTPSVNRPEILNPIELPEPEILSTTEQPITTSVPTNSENGDDIRRLLNDSLVPAVVCQCDQKPKLLVTYPVVKPDNSVSTDGADPTRRLLDLLVPKIVEELAARERKLPITSGYYADRQLIYRRPTVVKVVPPVVTSAPSTLGHGNLCGCPYCAKYVRELNE